MITAPVIVRHRGRIRPRQRPWTDLIRDGAGKGRRNDGASVVGHLIHGRVDADHHGNHPAVNDARCRPPLSHAEVITIVDSIAALELKKRIN